MVLSCTFEIKGTLTSEEIAMLLLTVPLYTLCPFRAKVSAGAWRRPQGALQRGVSADFHVMGLVSLPLTQEKREVQEWFLLVMSREISDALEMSEGS